MKILESGRRREKIVTVQGTEFFNRNFHALMKDMVKRKRRFHYVHPAHAGEEGFQNLLTWAWQASKTMHASFAWAKRISWKTAYNTKMWRYCTARKTERYWHVWFIVFSYNQGLYRSFKPEPVLVSIVRTNMAHVVWWEERSNCAVYGSNGWRSKNYIECIEYEKGYLPNFSKEILT